MDGHCFQSDATTGTIISFFRHFEKEKVIFKLRSDLEYSKDFVHIEARSNFLGSFSKENFILLIPTISNDYTLYTCIQPIEGKHPFLGFSRNSPFKKSRMPHFAKFSKKHWVKSVILKYG